MSDFRSAVKRGEVPAPSGKLRSGRRQVDAWSSREIDEFIDNQSHESSDRADLDAAIGGPSLKTKLDYVEQYKDRHGKLWTYYRRAGRRQQIEGEPGSPEWLTRYAEIHKSFEAPLSPVPDHDTFRFAVNEYLRSRSFATKAESTRETYRIALGRLVEKLGDHKLTSFTRGTIIKVRDTIAARSPSMAVLSVAVLKNMFQHACDCDVIDRNPAKAIREPEAYKKQPHRRWTDDEIAHVTKNGGPFVRRAMMVLLFIGCVAPMP